MARNGDDTDSTSDSDSDPFLSTIPELSDDGQLIFVNENESTTKDPRAKTDIGRLLRASRLLSPEVPDSHFWIADKILQKQVEWLIDIAGVRHPQFGDVVRVLWFKYLTKAVPNMAESLGQIGAASSKWLGSLRKADFCELLACPPRSLQSVLDYYVLLARELPTVATEECDRRRNSRCSKKSVVACEMRHDYTRLSMVRILVILVFALHICREDILLSDMLFWIRTMQFPYINPVLDSQKEYVAFGALLTKSLSVVPPYVVVQYEMYALQQVIFEEHGYTSSLSLIPAIERFVQELNIPMSLVPIAARLVEHIGQVNYVLDLKCPSTQNYRAANYEATAMVYIIYSLILLLGMDDEAEHAICEQTSVLQLMFPDIKFFNFKEWSHHIDVRRVYLYRHTVLLPQCSLTAQVSFMDQNAPPADVPSHRPVRYYRLQRVHQEVMDELVKDQLLDAQRENYLVKLSQERRRPFLAHTRLIEDRYPTLKEDFSDTVLEHLMANKEVVFQCICEKRV